MCLKKTHVFKFSFDKKNQPKSLAGLKNKDNNNYFCVIVTPSSSMPSDISDDKIVKLPLPSSS